MKFPKPIPFKELRIRLHMAHVAASRFTREQAIEMAKPYHLMPVYQIIDGCL